jgi:hypothetical protein
MQKKPNNIKNFALDRLCLITIKIRKATVGIKNRKSVIGLQNPHSHSFFPSDSIKSQKLVTISNNFIISEFGIPISSVKKTSELKIKKIVSIGAKIRLPMNVIVDICKPQPTRIGIDANVTIN